MIPNPVSNENKNIPPHRGPGLRATPTKLPLDQIFQTMLNDDDNKSYVIEGIDETNFRGTKITTKINNEKVDFSIENYSGIIDGIAKDFQTTPLTYNSISQEQVIHKAFKPLTIKEKIIRAALKDVDCKNQMLKDLNLWDANWNALDSKGLEKEEDYKAQIIKIENRLTKELQRIENMKKWEQDINARINAMNQYIIREFFSTAALNALVSDLEWFSGSAAEKLKQITAPGYVSNIGEAFNLFDAALNNDFHGTKLTIHKGGDKIDFNPKNWLHFEIILALALADPDVTEIKMTLGHGVSNDYQLFGKINPANDPAMYKAGKKITFLGETGISEEAVIDMTKKGNTPHKIKTEFNTLLLKLNTLEFGSDAWLKASKELDECYKKNMATFSKGQKDPETVIHRLSSDRELKVEIPGLILATKDKKNFEIAKELKSVAQEIVGQYAQYQAQLQSDKLAKLNSLEEERNKLPNTAENKEKIEELTNEINKLDSLVTTISRQHAKALERVTLPESDESPYKKEPSEENRDFQLKVNKLK